MRARFAWLFVVLASCVAEPPPYAPLECDPSRAGELAFGEHVAGAFFSMPEHEANGDEFLFIDHACTYWTLGLGSLVVRTGTLDEATLASINLDLLTGPWTSVDGELVTSCCDGATTYVARDDVRASVYRGATGASGALSAFVVRSHTWAARLAEQGAPMTGGRVRVELQRTTVPGDATIVAWPSPTPLADELGAATVGSAVFEGDTADALRATRHGVFEDGAVYASFVVVDTIPLADASGCLRPIGGPACR